MADKRVQAAEDAFGIGKFAAGPAGQGRAEGVHAAQGDLDDRLGDRILLGAHLIQHGADVVEAVLEGAREVARSLITTKTTPLTTRTVSRRWAACSRRA